MSVTYLSGMWVQLLCTRVWGVGVRYDKLDPFNPMSANNLQIVNYAMQHMQTRSIKLILFLTTNAVLDFVAEQLFNAGFFGQNFVFILGPNLETPGVSASSYATAQKCSLISSFACVRCTHYNAPFLVCHQFLFPRHRRLFCSGICLCCRMCLFVSHHLALR